MMRWLKQETLSRVDTFLTACDENIAQKVRDLKECTLSFEKATGRDLPKRFDTLAEVWIPLARLCLPDFIDLLLLVETLRYANR